MSEQEIIQLGNPLLRQTSQEIVEFNDAISHSLVQDLNDTLSAFRSRTGYGRGIAAPQIGKLHRMIFIRMQPSGFCGPLLNPKIVWSSAEQMKLWDDCFSFPDLMVLVLRSVSVSVEYRDERGLNCQLNAEGAFSELLQHEIDHLDGVLALDRAVSPQALMIRAEWERQKASKTLPASF